jgi:hypothetical protein
VTLRPLFLDVSIVTVGKIGEFGMSNQKTYQKIETIVECIDDMMHLSEKMYEERLHSNYRQYYQYKDQYEQKKELMKRALCEIILKVE